MDFTTAIEHILNFEGGLVDDPKDPGKITKFGISLRAYPELGEAGIRALTKDEAIAIYKKDYWDYLWIDNLPDGLRLIVFDCGVNQGVHYASKALQAAVSVTTDGIIGPKTLEAAHNTNVERAVHRMGVNRFSRYARNKNWEVYGEGWMSRLLAVTMLTLR